MSVDVLLQKCQSLEKMRMSHNTLDCEISNVQYVPAVILPQVVRPGPQRHLCTPRKGRWI